MSRARRVRVILAQWYFYATPLQLAVFGAIVFIAAVPAGLLLWGCEAKTSVRGGQTSIVRENIRSEPVTAHETRVIEHVDPGSGKVVGRENVERVEGGGGRTETKVDATAIGASGAASGKEAKLNVSGDPPTLETGEGDSGSGGGFRGKAWSLGDQGGWVCWVVGGLLIAGGLVMFQRGLVRPALNLAGLGVAVILMGVWPVLFWGVVAAAAVGVVMHLVDARDADQSSRVLGKLQRAVKLADADGPVGTVLSTLTTGKEDLHLQKVKTREDVP